MPFVLGRLLGALVILAPLLGWAEENKPSKVDEAVRLQKKELESLQKSVSFDSAGALRAIEATVGVRVRLMDATLFMASAPAADGKDTTREPSLRFEVFVPSKGWARRHEVADLIAQRVSVDSARLKRGLIVLRTKDAQGQGKTDAVALSFRPHRGSDPKALRRDLDAFCGLLKEAKRKKLKDKALLDFVSSELPKRAPSPELKEVFQPLSVVHPSEKYEFMRLAAREAGVEGWTCPEAQAFFAPPGASNSK